MPPESPATEPRQRESVRGRLAATVLDALDPPTLAAFYAAVLGWVIIEDNPDWARIGPPDGSRPGLSFQLEPLFRQPSWPSRDGEQQMQLHLDIAVDDLDAAVTAAEGLGARQAEYQPQEDVRVMLDPEGHVFDLFAPGA
jgi:catechol 2,3-dioxygenase-like lactoylglutathione lyase family enzyme